MANISCKDFLKGTAAGALSMAVAGFGANAFADEAAATEWSWETYPGDITPDEVIETDVVVVGCGFAGSVAAVSAAEQGAKVVVVDKAAMPSGRGGHITSFGSKVVQQALADGYITEADMDYPQIVRNWIRWSHGRLNERILWMFAHKSGAAMD